MVQFLSPEGDVRVPAQWAEYGEYLKSLTEADYLKFYREMAQAGSAMSTRFIASCITARTQ